MKKGQQCSYCLTDIRPWARKCHACGEWTWTSDSRNNHEPDRIDQNISEVKWINDNSKQNWIIGIVISMICIILVFWGGFLIWYFWAEIKNALPKKDAYNYVCNTSSSIESEYNKKFSIKCGKNSSKIQIQYKDRDIMIIDWEELLNKCGQNTICDKENSIQLFWNSGTGWFIVENNIVTKNPNLYVLSFINKPSDPQKLQSLKNIFEIYTLNFWDSVYVDILGSSSDPLILNYRLPPISIEIFNLEKNHQKTFTLWIWLAEKDDQEFNYEKALTFFNKNQFEEHLNKHLSELKTQNRDSVAVFDYINNEFERLKNEKFSNKYFSLYINSYPTFPIIWYGRELNEWSCNDWKNMSIRYNRDVDFRYNRCWNSGAKWCVRWSKISGDYWDVYLSKIQGMYPNIRKWNSISFVDIPWYDIESIQDETCKWELKNTLSKIKSNLVTSSNP